VFECPFARAHDVVDVLVATGEVDDRGHPHAGPRQRVVATGDELRPHAHGRGLVTGRPLTQRSDPCRGMIVCEVGEVDEPDDTECRRLHR
jgi:hypothetical protein